MPMALGPFITGRRDDLDLNSRWWHRLLKVVFILIMLLVSAIAAYESSGLMPTPTQTNVTVLQTLGDFSLKSTADNTIPVFLKQSGRVGVLNHDTGEFQWASEYVLKNGRCSAQPFGYLEEKTGKPLAALTVASVYKLVPTPLDGRKQTDDGYAHCWLPTDIGAQYAIDVVKYEFTDLA